MGISAHRFFEGIAFLDWQMGISAHRFFEGIAFLDWHILPSKGGWRAILAISGSATESPIGLAKWASKKRLN